MISVPQEAQLRTTIVRHLASALVQSWMRRHERPEPVRIAPDDSQRPASANLERSRT